MDSLSTQRRSKEPKALRIRNDSMLVIIVKHVTKSNGAEKRKEGKVKN